VIPLGVTGVARGVIQDILGKVSFKPAPKDARPDTVRVLSGPLEAESVDGYAALIVPSIIEMGRNEIPTVCGCNTSHLAQGDVVSISPQGYVIRAGASVIRGVSADGQQHRSDSAWHVACW
jgi:hypothetical protein